MPTRNISLTTDQSAFIDKVVSTGEYQNASETVREALRVLMQRRREDALRLRLLRAQLKEGVDAIDRGDFLALDESELSKYLAKPRARRRKAPR